MAHMGGPGNPNFSLKLSRRQFFSQSLQTGTSHMVARLFPDESGPTEVGGLILQSASRGHKLGRFLSLIRFHFIALNRPLFADRVIAEMMGPITIDGLSPLWEALGRRFIPLSYAEADKHCQRSREFISALLPKEDIYLSLLPPEARDAVGKVHEETLPARAMLEKLGFACKDLVDCFDGGPQLEAATESIPLIKATYRGAIGEPLAERRDADGEFRAVDAPYDTDARGRIRLPRGVLDEVAWSVGLAVGVTPIEDRRKGAGPGRRGRSRRVGA
jgi:arginine N-succinyltransferase